MVLCSVERGGRGSLTWKVVYVCYPLQNCVHLFGGKLLETCVALFFCGSNGSRGMMKSLPSILVLVGALRPSHYDHMVHVFCFDSKRACVRNHRTCTVVAATSL